MHLRLIHITKQLKIEVEEDTSMEQLRQVAAKFSNIPAEVVRIFFRGRPCPEEGTLEDNGIHDGARLHVVRSIEKGQAPAPVENQPKEETLEDKLTAIEKEIDEIENQMELLGNHQSVAENEEKRIQPHVLNELLTQKLLKLDNFEVEGEMRQFRKRLINRINELCSKLDQFQ